MNTANRSAGHGRTEEATVIEAAALDADRRRNTWILVGCLTLTWSLVPLAAGFAAITLSELFHHKQWAGLAPALFLGGWALGGPVAGRFMDDHGRKAGLAAGFAGGALVCVLLWVSTANRLLVPFLLGNMLIGVSSGWLNLAARAGATDMYPPERRARGLGYVLSGAAIGAVAGPLLFSPLLDDVGHDTSGLSTPWLAAAAMMAAGLTLAFSIRRDPLEFPQPGAGETADMSVRPGIGELMRRPGVGAAIVAAVVAQAVMSSSMTVIGVALRDHGHDLGGVSFAVSVHFLGMFALVLVVGAVVDRIGYTRAMGIGLSILTLGLGGLAAGAGFGSVLPAMFAIGAGWNVAYVAATAQMSGATRPDERGRLFGFADLLASGASAFGVVGAGAVLDAGGLPLLAVIGASVAVVPLLLGARPKTRAA